MQQYQTLKVLVAASYTVLVAVSEGISSSVTGDLGMLKGVVRSSSLFAAISADAVKVGYQQLPLEVLL